MDKFGIEKLGSNNYEQWSFQVKSLLMREELWKYVISAPPDPVTTAWTNGDIKTQGTIALFVGIMQHALIRKCESAKDIWDVLQKHFTKTSLTTKVSILKRIVNQTYNDGDNMGSHLHEMEDMFQRLANAKLELDETLRVVLILRSLPSSFETLTMALESRPETELTMDVVKNKLLDEALKRNEKSGCGESILRVESNSKTIICHHCQKPGHIKRECRMLNQKKDENRKTNTKPQKNKPRAQAVRENENDPSEFAFAAGPLVGSAFNPERSEMKEWIVDSGASSHMCSDESFFNNIKSVSNMTVTLADGRVANVTGKGTGKLCCRNQNGKKTVICLSDVLFVPELDVNLISVGQLTDKGAEIRFTVKECFIQQNNYAAAVAPRRGGLYNLIVSQQEVMTVAEQHPKDCLHNWHRKFGHRDIDAIRRLKREGLATGISVRDCSLHEECECCLQGKMTRLPFPKQSCSQSTKIADLVHTDICGPMNTVTPGGARYFMVIIDDFSRFATVFFLKRKSEAVEKMQDYVEMVHTRFGRYPTAIRSDQGGEYKSKQLGRFYRERGITPQFTTAYTPQQNGVAERKNRTLVEMARCMLLDAGMGYRYWAEAINTATYLQNLLPNRTIKLTPHEIWYGQKPDLAHLHMFGCQAYVHIPAEKRTKLELKAKKMTFVGYSDRHKGYRFIEPSSDKIVFSRDARFLENEKAIKRPLNQPEMVEIDSYVKDENIPAPPPVLETGESESESEYESGEETLASSSDETVTPLRKSTRITQGVPPIRYPEAINMVKCVPEPRNYDEAVNGQEGILWKAAIEEELKSLSKNCTWELTTLPAGRKAIGSKWIFKRKEDEYGNVVRYKARLVAQGFTQKYGTDYDEVFAPVVKQMTFRVLLSIASQKKMLIKHADVKTAYLHGVLEETIFMRPPPGTNVEDPNLVCHLHRSLYGLKQAARVWNKTFDRVIKQMGFVQSINDSCLYIRKNGEKTTYLVVYVDDLVVVCENEEEYVEIITELNQHFEVMSLGEIRYFLGIEVQRTNHGISLKQKTYIKKLLERFGMQDAKSSKIPLNPGHIQTKEEKPDNLSNNHQYASLIGGLLYVAVNTRPDIAVSVSILGRKTSNPSQADWVEAKRVLRYLKETIDHELVLGVNNSPLHVYVDADWAGDYSDRKSTSGFLFRFAGGSISWGARKQTCVTLSSTEAEYVALAECCQEIRWIQRILKDFSVASPASVIVFEDNQGCIKQASSQTIGRRSKHVETKYHYIRELQQSGEIELRYCPTEEMVADMLTKPLLAVKLKQFREAAGVLPSRRSVGDCDEQEASKL